MLLAGKGDNEKRVILPLSCPPLVSIVAFEKVASTAPDETGEHEASQIHDHVADLVKRLATVALLGAKNVDDS